MNFKQMKKTAKNNARLSLGITAPLTILSILMVVFDLDKNAIFSGELQFYEVIFYIPLWIAFICSILGFVFKNGNALEKLSKVTQPLIYLILPIPLKAIIKTDIFSFTQHAQNQFFLIFTLIATLIGFVFILYLLIFAIFYEKEDLSMEENFDKYCKKQGLSNEEIKEFKRDFKEML